MWIGLNLQRPPSRSQTTRLIPACGRADEIAGDLIEQIEAAHTRKLLIDTRRLVGRLDLVSTYVHMLRYPRHLHQGYAIRHFEDPKLA